MSKDEKENRSQPESGALDKFEPGGESGPIDDRNEYEQRLNSLPAEQKEFAEESTRFADLCQYFSQQRWIFRRPSSRGLEMFPSFQCRIAFAP